jgi:large subunit ribosomal protein L3
MANTRKPRRGSMGYWPRKRASKIYPRVRHWPTPKTDKPVVLGFIGYKAGMTHLMGIDVKKTSMTKNEEIRVPVTVIECPPIKLFALRLYKKNAYGLYVSDDYCFKPAKELERKICLPKTFSAAPELDKIVPDECEDITVLAYGQPGMTGTGKKKPELFELKLSGSKKDKLDFVKANFDKEIHVENVFKEAQFIDVHAVTKGKGLQGPIKRFGIGLKPHKTEKGRRQPGSRGGWKAQQHTMYRTAYSGQMGFHPRMQLHSQIVKIGTRPEEVNPVDGFMHYGKIKNSFLLLKGSVPGTTKRPIMLTYTIRPNIKESVLPTITSISIQSKQGR